MCCIFLHWSVSLLSIGNIFSFTKEFFLGLTGSALDHGSLPTEFEFWHGDIWRVFHLWPRFITFGGHSAHRAYHVHKSGRKTSIVILFTRFFSHRTLGLPCIKWLFNLFPLYDWNYAINDNWNNTKSSFSWNIRARIIILINKRYYLKESNHWKGNLQIKLWI